jgi:hypothetical protein
MTSDLPQTTFNAYSFAFSFWSLLTTEREDLGGAVALANLEAPFLLSNAAWYPKVGKLKTIAKWYAKRGLPPAIIVPTLRDEPLECLLKEGPFMREQSFKFSPISVTALLRQNHQAIEQASWLQSRVVAELLAAHFGGTEFALGISQTLSRAMQGSSLIRTYIAYQTRKTLAAMVTFEQHGRLAAMLMNNSQIFTQTLLQEVDTFKMMPYVFETESDDAKDPSLCLERWSIR